MFAEKTARSGANKYNMEFINKLSFTCLALPIAGIHFPDANTY